MSLSTFLESRVRGSKQSHTDTVVEPQPSYCYAIRQYDRGGRLVDYMKVGRWTGSVKKLRDRYRTYYGSLDVTVFQVEDDKEVEKTLFIALTGFRWKRELFDVEGYGLFLEQASKLAFPATFHYDGYLDRQVKALRVKQKEEIAALRRRPGRESSQAKPVPKSHAEKVAELILNDVFESMWKTVKANEKEKARADTINAIDHTVRRFLIDSTCEAGTEQKPLRGKELYRRFELSTPSERDRKTKLGYRRFLWRVEETWGTHAQDKSRVTEQPDGTRREERFASSFVGRQLIENVT